MKPILSAEVRLRRGTTRQLTAEGPIDLSSVARVTIAAQDEGWFLFHYDAEGHLLADTWHASIEEAKRQAAFEYDLEDWKQAGEDDSSQA